MKQYMIGIIFAAVLLCGGVAASGPELKLIFFDRHNGGGIEFAGGRGEFIPFPELKLQGGKTETPRRVSPDMEDTLMKYPCGALLKATVISPGRCQLILTDIPEQVSGLRQTVTLPLAPYLNGHVELGGKQKVVGVANQGVEITGTGQHSIGMFRPDGEGYVYALSKNAEVQLQDNRAWNWDAFQIVFSLPVDSGKLNYSISIAPGRFSPAPAQDRSGSRIDRYGQVKGGTFQPVQSDQELRAQLESDKSYYDGLTVPANLDQYGGIAGTQEKYGLPVSGFFRTGRAGNRDVLVTPEGNVFFLLGCCGLGMCDTITLFDGRREFFDEIPRPDSEFSSAFYFDDRHFSFYKANILRKFGNISDNRWAEIFAERLKKWGFNTCGPFNSVGKIPAKLCYVEVLTPPESFHLVRGMIDPFDRTVLEKLDQRLKRQLTPRAQDPFLIGYFINNEPPLNEIVRQVPKMSGEVPAKQTLARMLLEQYGTVEKLNQAWGSALSGTLADCDLSPRNDRGREDLQRFFELYLDTYFREVTRIIRLHDPNHLLLGMRYMPHTVSPKVAAITSKYVDVFSMNYYTHAIDAAYLKEIHKNSKRPMLMSEWNFGEKSHGLAGGARNTRNEEERGLAYRNYLEQTISLPFVVGSNFFQCLDQAGSGRWIGGVNGERFNTGLVDVTDRPYRTFLKSVMASHHRIADVAFGRVAPFRYDAPGFQAGRRSGRKELMISPVVQPVQLDGSIAGWPQLPGMTIGGEDLVDGVAGTVQQADFRACYDRENLYFHIEVADPTPLRNRRDGRRIWEGDCIELFFGVREIERKGGPLPSDRQLTIAAKPGGEAVFNWYNNGELLEARKIPVLVESSGDGRGYRVQVAIPFSVLNIDPEKTPRMLFDIGFGDSEDGVTRARHYMWNGSERNARERSGYGIAEFIR